MNEAELDARIAEIFAELVQALIEELKDGVAPLPNLPPCDG